MRVFSGAMLAALAVVAMSMPRSNNEPPFSTAPVSVPDTNIAPVGLPQLEAVEVAHHDSFDRVVFRFSSLVPGYNVSYVPTVTADPSDEHVALEGNAFILVAMHSVASSQVGAPAAPQDRLTPRFPELREIAGAGDFEGVVSFGLGLTAESGFRVFTLTKPDRLVVDLRIPGLAATGSTTGPMILIATILVLAGVGAVHGARRNARSSH